MQRDENALSRSISGALKGTYTDGFVWQARVDKSLLRMMLTQRYATIFLKKRMWDKEHRRPSSGRIVDLQWWKGEC